MKPADAARPIFVPPHAGRVLDFLAVTHKLTSAQTGGACYLFESTFEPGTGSVRSRRFRSWEHRSRAAGRGSR